MQRFEQAFARALQGLLSSSPDDAETEAALHDAAEAFIVGSGAQATAEGVRAVGASFRKLTDAPWSRAFMKLDPLPALHAMSAPALLVFGGKDSQVLAGLNVPVASGLADERGAEVTVKTFPDLNHLFQACESGAPDEYAAIATTMEPEVLDAVATWILERTR